MSFIGAILVVGGVVGGVLYLAALLVLVGYLGWRVIVGALLSLMLLASIASPAEEKEGALFRALGFATYGTVAGDALSTELALSRGFAELNPLQQNRYVRTSAHILYPAVANWGTSELYRDGKKKTALWLRIVSVAAFGYVTAHNLRQVAR